MVIQTLVCAPVGGNESVLPVRWISVFDIKLLT